jgi:hypothetical protein
VGCRCYQSRLSKEISSNESCKRIREIDKQSNFLRKRIIKSVIINPIGRALLNKEAGDSVEISAPSGELELEVPEITYKIIY